jgi:hypothetical protein
MKLAQGAALKCKLQVPLEVHTLMKDSHNQDTILGLAVENRMANRFYLSIVGPDMARVASEVGKLRQHSECFVQPQNVFLSPGEAPFLQRGFGDSLNVVVSSTR